MVLGGLIYLTPKNKSRKYRNVMTAIYLKMTNKQGVRLMITIERIKNIAEDIIADDEWVNDSHTKSEHAGVKAGLEMLIRHLEEVQQ